MSTEVAAVPPLQSTRREIAQVIDPIPILDTARFEHMQRIATVMAHSNLIPDTLCFEKNDQNQKVALPIEMVTANCFLVVNQAVRWNMDPFAVAQCVSVVHGKLCHEGKLIAAVLQGKLGVELEYEFSGEGDAMKVVVTGTIDGLPVLDSQGQPKTVEGTVGEWKTEGRGSPWAARGGHRRMLRYRGAREWGRIHAPGLMLGVYGDDELADLADEARARRATPVTSGRPMLSQVAGQGAEGGGNYRRQVVDHDAEAGTNDATSTGGQTHEVDANTDKGDLHVDSSSSSSEDRSATVQHDSQAGAAPANETIRQASAQPAPADAGASPSPHEDSPQPDLLSGATTRDGSGQPADRQAEGAGASRGETAPAPTRHPASPERLLSYSKALATIENGGPAKLGKQSTAWITRNGDFDAAGNETAGKILSVHTQRVAGELTMEACLKRVKEITG